MERYAELLRRDPVDRYTFQVLSRLLEGECAHVETEGERFILCRSEPDAPYPVWIWTPDDADEAEMRRAYERAEAAFPLSEGYRYNLKYGLAEYFIKTARARGLDAGYHMRLFAYDCPEPIAPAVPAPGRLHKCTEADIDIAARLAHGFARDIGDGRTDYESALERTKYHIENGRFFFWLDASDKPVACCSYRPSGQLASLGSVYTVEEERRKHYARQLVYEVTRRVADEGFTPMLYTDADYAASNACYTQVGYVLRGRLCTIGLTEEKR